MRRLFIDFAPPSVRCTVARLHPLAWLAGCASLVLCTGTGWHFWQAARQYQLGDIALHRLLAQRHREVAEHATPPTKPIDTLQADAVNAAVARLNLPWRDVLDAIEAGTPANVALLSLEPDVKTHQVHVQAEAESSDAMIAYIEQLKRQPLFDAVILTHHAVDLRNPNKPIRFRLDAYWREGQS